MDMILDYVRDLIFVRDTENALFCGRDVIMRSNVFPFLSKSNLSSQQPG